MFTSNGKIYCERDAGIELDSSLRGLVPESNRGYNEDLLGTVPARTGHSSQPVVNGDGNHFNRRIPPRSSSNREYEGEQRKVHFRNGRRRMHGKDGRTRGFSIRDGVSDEGSSVSSDQRYGASPGFARMTPDYLRAKLDRLRATPEFKMTTKHKYPPDLTKTPPQFAGHQSHGNQLLNLRAALSEKELQLVELREQHNTTLNRAADARQNWEEALKSKDRVIVQLQRTLQHKKALLDRQERENRDNLHALRKRQEENTAVEKKEQTIALLEAKNAQFAQELVEQQKLITKMKRHIDEKEKLGAGQHQKLEMMNGRVQDLKAALQEKEEEADTQSTYCNELKTLLWKRDSKIAELQLSEQQLQSKLAREVVAREAVSICRDKVQQEKALLEKALSEMQSQCKGAGNGGSRSDHQKGSNESEIRKLKALKDDFSNVQEGAFKHLDDKEGVVHRMQKRMHELQRSVRSKDNALSDKNNELQQALQETQRLTEGYKSLKQEFDEVNKRNDELEGLAQLQDYTDGQTGASISEAPVEVLPYEFSLGGSAGEDLGVDDPLLECVESLERLSNASVCHAKFEKVKITKVEVPDIDFQHQQQQRQQQRQEQQQQHQEQREAPVPLVHTRLSSKCPSPKILSPPSPPATSPRREPVPEAVASAPTRPSSPPSGLPHQCDEVDAQYNSIQDEITKRERCWRKTEELMRAALTRRMKLLEEAKEVHSSETNLTWSAKAGLELQDRSGLPHNHQHFLREETCSRRNPRRKTKMLEQENQVERRVKNGNGNSLHHYVPYREHFHEDGHVYHELVGARDQRQSLQRDVYLGGKANRDIDYFKIVDDGIIRQPHAHQGVALDRPKRVDRTNHLEPSKY